MKINLIKRSLSTIFMIPIVVFLTLKGGFFFIFLLITSLIISLFEWRKMVINKFLNLLGVFFIIFSFYSAYSLRITEDEAKSFNFLAILLICIFTDIGGYIFGKILKGPKITKISPNKTYAGAFGGFFCSIFFLYLILNYTQFFNSFSFNFKNITYILFLSLISQIGDIIMSYFKRLYNKKDTGNIIPGHGGILDRIDGMIFVFPSALIFNNFL